MSRVVHHVTSIHSDWFSIFNASYQLTMITRRRLLEKLVSTTLLGITGTTALPTNANIVINNPINTSVQRSPITDAELDDTLASFRAEAQQQERLKSVVISLRGETIFAEAFRGPPVNRAVNIKSVSKSVVSTLLGVARYRSVIQSLDQTLEELTPRLLPKDVDERVRKLTLTDLVTMRTGLQRTSGANYGVWVNSNNWIQHVLTRPFVDEPGGRMLYSTGDTHVLGAVLSVLTGQSLHSLANDWLGKPLNITFPAWTRDPQGYFLGGNEMALSPLHLVKLGELYLNNGLVKDKRVFDENWVSDTFTPRTRSLFSGDGYGYGWFLRPMAGLPAAYARGYGGQVLHVIPDLQLTVAITSNTAQRARSNGYMTTLHKLVERQVVMPLKTL